LLHSDREITIITKGKPEEVMKQKRDKKNEKGQKREEKNLVTFVTFDIGSRSKDLPKAV
jgi:hypothetical protein